MKGRKPGSLFKELSAWGTKEETPVLSPGIARLGWKDVTAAVMFRVLKTCQVLRVITEERAVSGIHGVGEGCLDRWHLSWAGRTGQLGLLVKTACAEEASPGIQKWWSVLRARGGRDRVLESLGYQVRGPGLPPTFSAVLGPADV